MTGPELRENAGIYTITWPAYNIGIRIDRLRDEHGSLTGEALIKSTMPGLPSHLHQARLNLTSTQARRTIAKHLEERASGLDWNAMIEQACVFVLQKYRAGEPPVKIADIKPKEKLKFRVSPLLLESQPNLIYGPGGVGKSLFALYLAVLVEENWPHNSLEPEPGKVLYLDYEASAEETQERAQAIHAGLGIVSSSSILYRFCHQPLPDDIAEVQRLVAEESVKLVVIDSAGPACGGQPESAEMTLKYFNALRSLRGTTLTIAHVAKNPERKTPFGSVYWENMSRSVFEIKKVQQPGEDLVHFGLFHRKMNSGRLLKPMGFKLNLHMSTWRLASVIVEKEEVADVPEFNQELPLYERIAAFLTGGAQQVKEIAEGLSENEDSIRTTLNRHKNIRFTKVGEGWGLLAKS